MIESWSKEDLIQSLPTLQKQADQLEQFRAMQKVFTQDPLGRDFVAATGVNVAELEQTFAKLDELEATFEDHVEAVYTFNTLFAVRGWVVYDHLNLDLIKKVNQKGLVGELEAAEQMLVEYYDEATVRWKLKLFGSVKAFRLRVPLARKTLEDYAAERYHACVPVVLALADGLVNELHETHRGLFAEGTNLTAWDSVAAHSQGLAVLVRTLSKRRVKTTTEPLTPPYRNGIMHGNDLGYGNKMVAAKTWALLFTVRDWAYRAEHGQLSAPPEEPEPTLAESLRAWKNVQQNEVSIEAWGPRNLSFGVDLPVAGTPDLYQEGTPERVLVTMLNAWQRGNYGGIADCMCWGIRTMPKKELFYRLRNWCADRSLLSFELMRFERQLPGCTDIVTSLRFVDDEEKEHTVAFRLSCETSAGQSSFERATDAQWGLFWWDKPNRQ